MSRFARWPRHLAVLTGAILVAGLLATLLVHAMPRPNRGGRRSERPRERREFAGPELRAGAPAFLKQLVIVGVIALVGRKVFRIRI